MVRLDVGNTGWRWWIHMQVRAVCCILFLTKWCASLESHRMAECDAYLLMYFDEVILCEQHAARYGICWCCRKHIFATVIVYWWCSMAYAQSILMMIWRHLPLNIYEWHFNPLLSKIQGVEHRFQRGVMVVSSPLSYVSPCKNLELK